ncbi:restriction endonuclease subunit S [Enterococcus faecalis]|uniref:restriction endonuclease subunit S n=1 Tax=Enterococcus faecalis TaxID=1351 RepID=UPI0032D95266
MNLLFVFTLIGVWEQRKLNEVSDIYDGTHQTPKYQDDGVMFLSVENIKTLTSNKFISREAFEDEFKIRPQRGDVLMTRIGDIGTANVVETDEDLAYYVSLALFKSEELNPYFLQASIYAPFVQDQIWKRTLHIAFPKKINKNEIGQVPINVPTLAEQTKIGSFFKQLDNTITLHQRKLEQLKELKKTYLQVMFPRKDERVPKLRFADFEGEWAQRKLGEISTHRSGTAIERYFTEDGKYKVISIGSYGTDSKYVDQGIRAISNEITNARVVHKGELTMVLNDKTSDGAIIGRSLLIESEEEYVINQRTEIISPKDDFNVNFAYTTLNNTFRQKVKKIVQGGTQIYVNYPAVKNLMLDFPSYKEQTKIGTFFKQFDDTITLHQNKLDQLKTLKKTYLQNMFI